MCTQLGSSFWGTMVDHNAGVGDCSIAWDVANVSAQKEKMVLVPLVMPVHPCACHKPPRYVPYKGTYVPYNGTYGVSNQGQTLDM